MNSASTAEYVEEGYKKRKGRPQPQLNCVTAPTGIAFGQLSLIDTNDLHIHPAQFCNRCWAATQKHRIAIKKMERSISAPSLPFCGKNTLLNAGLVYKIM